jgi:DNA polymerase IV (DinB-like DNA polymerase)
MPISEAWRLAEAARKAGKPETVFLQGNFSRYAEVSERIMQIVAKYSPTIEQASVDEAYFDLSSAGSYEEARKISAKIKKEIHEREKLTATIGIGPNKLIAKIASDMQKPDGLTVVDEEEAEAFLEPLLARKIPGVGPKTEEFLSRKGIKLVRDLKRFSAGELQEMLGKWGLDLYKKARGRDDSPLVTEEAVASVGEQETFSKDTKDLHYVMERLRALAKVVHRRLQTSGFTQFRTVVVMVRFHDFETKTRRKTLAAPTSSAEVLEFEGVKLLLPFFDKRENPKSKAIRLVGVRVERLA